MKEQYDKLTLHETEQLCRLYMDCRLSVLEETELQYVLSRVDYHSPVIDDVRGIMGITRANGGVRTVQPKPIRRYRLSKRLLYPGIAASIAIIFSLGIVMFHGASTRPEPEHSYYIAYAGGRRLNDDAARQQIEADKKKAEAFFKKMSELEARDRQLIDNFTKLNPLEK